jgi:hypothetical protein
MTTSGRDGPGQTPRNSLGNDLPDWRRNCPNAPECRAKRDAYRLTGAGGECLTCGQHLDDQVLACQTLRVPA